MSSQKSRKTNPYASYAKKILTDILALKPNENLTIEAWEHELEFANELKFEARKMGANPVLISENEPNFWRLYEEGAESSVGRVGKHEWSLVENSDAYVFFPGPADLNKFLTFDPKRRSASSSYNSEWYKRAKAAGVRGVRLRTSYVSGSRAKLYRFNLSKWRKNVLDGIDVDYENIEKRGRRLAGLFKRARNLEIKAPNGTDLRLDLSNAPAHIYSGQMTKQLRYNNFSHIGYVPGGEVDFVPDPGSVEGVVRFNRPILQMGKKLNGLEWGFKNGKLSHYSAKNNLGLFSKGYAKEKGDKDRLGLFTIGLNPRLSIGFNYDLVVNGSITLGLGSLDEGDKNKTGFGFTATLTGATLKAGSKIIVRNGSMLF